MGLALDVPHGWMVRVDDADRAVLCIDEDRAVDIPDMTLLIGVFACQFPGGFGEGVADLMRRRGSNQPPQAVVVGGRPAMAYDWTDGVSEVFSAFVELRADVGVELEVSSRSAASGTVDVENIGRTVLHSVDWLEDHPSAS